MRTINRRQWLKLSGAALALPFLPVFRGRANAQANPGGPKRLVMVHWPQGTVMRQWVPMGSERSFTLPYITEPLEPWREKLLFVTGADNIIPSFNEVGNNHFNANYTIFTGRPFYTQDSSSITAGGKSIEQEISERIGTETPFQRLDFAVGGQQRANGLYTPNEGAFFWYGPNDPVAMLNNPAEALLRVFGDTTIAPGDAWAQRSRRASVLGSVLENFRRMRGQLSGEDLARLEAHEDKLLQLESRISSGLGACSAPTQSTPTGFMPGVDDHISAPLFNELIATALSCDLTRVTTLTFANGHSPEFPWLWSRNGGRPIVDHALWENWHSVVHADYQPGMEHPYRWYHEMFADLLGRLESRVDSDGDNLLDTSLIVFASEYSSGRHWDTGIPIILAGNLGGVEMGRWIDHLGPVDAFVAANGYQRSGVTTNQIWTTVLRAFGFDDDSFGHSHETIPLGELPGLG